jgi:PleD family two-component response regulator
VEGVRHPLAISCGVASLGGDDSGFKNLFRRADAALSQTRLSGMTPA